MLLTLAVTAALFAAPGSSFKKIGLFVMDYHPIPRQQVPKLPEQFNKKGVAVIVVDVSDNTAVEYVAGKTAWSCEASTAAPQYATPRGTFRVIDIRWRPRLWPGDDFRAEYRRKKRGKLPKWLLPGDPRNGKGIAELVLAGGDDIKLHGNMDQVWVGTRCTLGCVSIGNGDLAQMIQNFRCASRYYVYIRD